MKYRGWNGYFKLFRYFFPQRNPRIFLKRPHCEQWLAHNKVFLKGTPRIFLKGHTVSILISFSTFEFYSFIFLQLKELGYFLHFSSFYLTMISISFLYIPSRRKLKETISFIYLLKLWTNIILCFYLDNVHNSSDLSSFITVLWILYTVTTFATTTLLYYTYLCK